MTVQGIRKLSYGKMSHLDTYMLHPQRLNGDVIQYKLLHVSTAIKLQKKTLLIKKKYTPYNVKNMELQQVIKWEEHSLCSYCAPSTGTGS